MGRGDMRTAKGKRTRGTYGNSRPKNAGTKKAPTAAAAPAVKKPAAAKPAPVGARKKS
jgi:ribosomal small subunit protein bTHX